MKVGLYFGPCFRAILNRKINLSEIKYIILFNPEAYPINNLEEYLIMANLIMNKKLINVNQEKRDSLYDLADKNKYIDADKFNLKINKYYTEKDFIINLEQKN